MEEKNELNICPVCEKENTLKIFEGFETITVRGISITVKSKKFICSNCKESMEAPKSDVYDCAYREYREMQGMLQPEEMKSIREQTLLSIEDFSKMSGIKADEIRRFENGALQDVLSDMIYERIGKMVFGRK